MKRIAFASTLILLIFLSSCGKDTQFLITSEAVGPLKKGAQIFEVDSIFENDSLVKLVPIANTLGTQGDVMVYEKGGAKLLLVSPENEVDPKATINHIQVFDSRYQTDKGLNLSSTFKDIKDHYEIKAIENAINAVVVFLKDSDVYVTIDKKQLPESLRYNYTATIESTQIPDEATFKYFMIGWDLTNN